MVDATALYQELILQHYRASPRRGRLEGEGASSIDINNPLCGDRITLHLRLDGDRVEAARFEGHGCSISQASASMMAQRAEGRTVEEVRRLRATFVRMLQGDPDAARNAELGDLRALAGVSKFPARVRCAMLPWEALETLTTRDPAD